MRRLIIIGSGAVAAELTSYITDNNQRVSPDKQFDIQGYIEFEANIEKYWAKYKMNKPVLGDIHSYSIREDDHFIVGIADIGFRLKMIDILNEKGAKIVNFIHHSTLVAETASFGIGNIIYPFCIVGPCCEMGNHNVVTSYSFLSHDCKIGDGNFFATAGLSGRVNVQDHNFFGIRSTVMPNLSIGSRNTIQAGMLIDKDVADDATVFYRYKEKVIAIPKNDN